MNFTRREFILGLGAVAATTLFSLRKPTPSRGEAPAPLPELTRVECDWYIKNVELVDGTGNIPVRGSLAVKGEQIAAVGEFTPQEGAQELDGQGLVLAPGFIDIHTHTESYVYSRESMAPFLSQGVTTQIGGNCGRSPRNMGGYLETLSELPINYGILMGYRTLREIVQGGARAGKTTPRELKEMEKVLAQGLEAGAVGLSVGLEYWPQNFATTAELISLCQVVKEKGGFYATHIRNEYDKVLEALEEAIEIGIQSGVSVQYSHVKAGYSQNWPKFAKVLEMLTEAQASGVDITGDVYPYTFSGNDVGTNPLRHSMSEENMEAALVHSAVFYASDTGIYAGGRANHPRAYGTYPRFLGEMVRERGLISLEKAIAKMTGEPAKRLRLANRGILQPGYQADLVLFDKDTVKDKALYNQTNIFSEGIRQVWVNGFLAWNEGKTTENKGGKVLM